MRIFSDKAYLVSIPAQISLTADWEPAARLELMSGRRIHLQSCRHAVVREVAASSEEHFKHFNGRLRPYWPTVTAAEAVQILAENPFAEFYLDSAGSNLKGAS